jgi:hypothetical protein
METLFASINDHIRDVAESRFPAGDPEGSLSERIQHAVERRAKGYETETKIILSTAARLWRYEVLIGTLTSLIGMAARNGR